MPKPVILCIGTNKIIGDSLGPCVGDILIMKYNIDAYVYGHTSRPINGNNYDDYLMHIQKHHQNNIIIAVDACLGNIKDIGKIKFSKNGITAGGALNKGYKRIGDIGILGIVAAAKATDNFAVLKGVDIDTINILASAIAKSILKLVIKINDIYSQKPLQLAMSIV